MIQLSKVCDAGDWFDKEFHNVIVNNLKEMPRFHRKQWEFAQIYLTLDKYDLLNADSTGLSMGGGNERVLYSIAEKIKKLFVTDLYEDNTSWDNARTDNPDKFIAENLPFPVDLKKIKALRMDMRKLDFADNTFDFCYSSCAVEHIGTYKDFEQHLNEVYRVLRNNGLYVFTTEYSFFDTTIEDENNYVFSKDYLKNLIDESSFSIELQPYIEVTEHKINNPLPNNHRNLGYTDEELFSSYISSEFPHVQLLRGKYPFTSVLLILRKAEKKEAAGVVFNIDENTNKFLKESVETYSEQLKKLTLNINPFSMLDKNRSPFYSDHLEFFSQKTEKRDELFHTDYFWFGSGERTFNINIFIDKLENPKKSNIELRVHRYRTLSSEVIETVSEIVIRPEEIGWIEQKIVLNMDEDYCYAILGKSNDSSFTFSKISIKSEMGNSFTESIISNKKENLFKRIKQKIW